MTERDSEEVGLSVLVQIRETRKGGVRTVRSTHDFASDDDREVAVGMASRGEEQIAHSLLCEALKREAFLQLLLLEQSDGILSKYRKSDRTSREEVLGRLSASLTESVSRTLRHMSSGVAQHVLEALSQGREEECTTPQGS